MRSWVEKLKAGDIIKVKKTFDDLRIKGEIYKVSINNKCDEIIESHFISGPINKPSYRKRSVAEYWFIEEHFILLIEQEEEEIL